MGDFFETFGNRPVFLSVIHVINLEQARENTKIAMGSGADGIFLINHAIGYRELVDIHKALKDDFPPLWMGMNCLELGLAVIDRAPLETEGLWVDNSGVTDISIQDEAYNFQRSRQERRWKGLYFGGVAFKGQRPVNDPAVVAQNAMPFVDVITTSGDRTGIPPSVGKIKAMKEAIGHHPLVIASGMTPDNVGEYVPYCNGFLVSTGISRSFVAFDPAKAADFAKQLGK